MLVGILVLIAGWAKSAQRPFHIWLPDAMVAPTTVSAYLHAASMVKVGVFVFLRYTQYALPALSASTARMLGYIVLVDALLTMFYGAFSYYRVRDLKRLLAYSTIVQLSIMFCALALPYLQGSPRGLYAAAYHMWNHAYAKALLFLTVGGIAYATGSRSIDSVAGLASAEKLKLLAYSWLASSLAVSAVPPFNCFFSKLAILFTGFRGPLAALAAVIIVFAEGYLLTLPIFLKISMSMFRGGETTRRLDEAGIGELPSSMKTVLVILIAATLVSAVLVPMHMPKW